MALCPKERTRNCFKKSFHKMQFLFLLLFIVFNPTIFRRQVCLGCGVGCGEERKRVFLVKETGHLMTRVDTALGHEPHFLHSSSCFIRHDRHTSGLNYFCVTEERKNSSTKESERQKNLQDRLTNTL
jgi:hypothetical protein